MDKHCVVSAFILSKIQEKWYILLINHKKLDKWLIPGGHIELNENPLEALVREIKEETGITSFDIVSFNHQNIYKFLDSESIISPEWILEEKIPQYKNELPHNHIDLLYITITNELQVILNENETTSIKWVRVDDISKYNTFHSTKFFSELILKKFRQFSPEIVCKVENSIIIQ